MGKNCTSETITSSRMYPELALWYFDNGHIHTRTMCNSVGKTSASPLPQLQVHNVKSSPREVPFFFGLLGGGLFEVIKSKL